MATYAQCTTYEQAISTATNTNVLAVQFSQDTSTEPILTAWDDDTHAATTKEMLAGTAGFAYCWLRGGITASNVATDTGAGSLPAGWTSQAGATTTFMLQGDTYYQTCSSAVDAGKQFRFVTTLFVPSDAAAGITGHNPVFTCKYTYTGSAPTITWYINTGTEGTPVWTELTASYSAYFTGPDSTASVLDPLTAPLSGTKYPEEFWVQIA